MRNRLICLVCLALLSTVSFAQEKAPPSGGGTDQPAIPSICNDIAPNLVSNCGFESGDFSLWDLSGPTFYTDVGTGPEVNSGTYGAFFGPIGETNTLSQSWVPEVGTAFHIEFWLANVLGGSPAHFEASFANQNLIVLDDPDPFEYTLFTFGPITATEETSTLAFVFRHDPWYFYLDDVDLELQSAVP